MSDQMSGQDFLLRCILKSSRKVKLGVDVINPESGEILILAHQPLNKAVLRRVAQSKLISIEEPMNPDPLCAGQADLQASVRNAVKRVKQALASVEKVSRKLKV